MPSAVVSVSDISVSCEDVTGTVKKEVTLTCSVSLKNSECCITGYKFQYPEKYNDNEICREQFPQDSCEQRNSFTCSFNSTTKPVNLNLALKILERKRPVNLNLTLKILKNLFGVNQKHLNMKKQKIVDLKLLSSLLLMKTMNAVNAVQLFILVWTFTAVCQADDHISVRCENVTGTVGEEVTLTCSVSLNKSECCILLYKFQYPEKYNDSEICREEFPQDSCEQRNSFTCSFNSTTAMTGEFRFFVQATCGSKITEFTVNITVSYVSFELQKRDPFWQTCDDISVRCEDVTGSVGKEVTLNCSVSLKKSGCCITGEKFPQDSCEQRNNFTCSFSPTTVMTEQFGFFVQINSGKLETDFTVNITDDISVSCEDVTGSVGKEVTLTCSVSLEKSGCCITVYEFYYTKDKNYSTICREEFPKGSCEQRNSFTCSFSPTTKPVNMDLKILERKGESL
ncbi:unnamed protein product [Leuciscus chuanchicus]